MRVAKSSKKKQKEVHAHGCKKCKTRYDDCCATPKVNGTCAACNGGKPWQLLIDNRKPAECCKRTSRLATPQEITSYRLAGDAPWFICGGWRVGGCGRTQIYDPKIYDPDKNRSADATAGEAH